MADNNLNPEIPELWIAINNHIDDAYNHTRHTNNIKLDLYNFALNIVREYVDINIKIMNTDISKCIPADEVMEKLEKVCKENELKNDNAQT